MILTKKNIGLLFLLLAFMAQAGTASPLFRIRQKGKEYLVEIPKRIIHRDFLLAGRVMTVSSPGNKLKLYAGQRLYDPVWVQLRYDKEQLYLLRPDPKNSCADTTSASYAAYARNAVTPATQSWKIEQETDSSIIVNWTRFFSDPIDGVDPFAGKTSPGRALPQLNKVLQVDAHEQNLEVSVQYGFEGATQPFLTTVRKSLLLLPKQPMQPREYDARVGYDNISKRIVNASQPSIANTGYITRFRMEPSDLKSYQKGKVVAPRNPIVFYIDDAFPPLWKKAIRKGILDWNRAFEEIGFKDALQVKTYAEAGKDFDADDIRFNCFRYVVSDFPNAMGKHWCDPRSGEILQADVLFHSNVISLLQKWYFLQTAAYNPTARLRELSEEVMEHLIRYAAAHEIGHCLGLEHNFKASYAYHTEDLRRPDFARQYGTTPSIMDYARFNYVAQPGDGVQDVFPPLLGVYDRYAIRIGYSYLPHEDARTVTGWIDKQQSDPMLRYGRMNPSPIPVDPTIQSSDLGDDAVASATYGIRNLRVLLEQLPTWNKDRLSDNPFEGMPASYDDVQKNYFDHLERVIPFLGTPGFSSEKATAFLLQELQEGYRFLVNCEAGRTNESIEAILKARKQIVEKMFGRIIAERIVSNQEKTGFTYAHYLETATHALFSGKAADGLFERQLQESYIMALKALTEETNASLYGTLFVPAVNKQLGRIRQTLGAEPSAWNDYLNNVSR